MPQSTHTNTGRTVTCPLCGAPPCHPVVMCRERGTLITANYLCLEGHAWQERWTEAA